MGLSTKVSLLVELWKGFDAVAGGLESKDLCREMTVLMLDLPQLYRPAESGFRYKVFDRSGP